MKPDELELEPLLDAKDVSQILRCSRPLIYKLASRGQLPCIRWDCFGNGGKRPRTVVRFKKSDVLDFLEANYEKQ